MKYTGALAKPVTWRRPKPLATIGEISEIVNSAHDEQISKLPALFDAYRLQYPDWMGFVLALAQAHVPGFQLAPPSGRPGFHPLTRARFRYIVEEFMARNPGLSTTDAIKHVAASADGKWITGGQRIDGKKIEALKKQFYKADPALVRVFRDPQANNPKTWAQQRFETLRVALVETEQRSRRE